MSTPENPNKNNNSHENEGAQVPNLEKALGSIYAGFSDEEKEKLAQKVANSEDVRKTLASMEAADLGALIAESPESAEQYKDIVNGILRSADVVKAPGTDVEVTKSKELVRPADFDQFDYDDAVATAATYATKPKWDLGWTKGVSLRNNVTTNWDRFHEARKDRRNYRLANKTKDMTPEERAAYMEKYDKRRRRVLKLGAYAIPIAIGAYGIFKIYQATKGVETATHGGGSVDHGQMAHNGDFRAAEEASYGPDREWFDYNNSDSSFYDFDHKAFHGDFGPALQASEKDGSMGPGFADWMSRHKHDPNGLANVISGLGLEGHDGSLTDRNELGDFLNGNIHEQMRLDKLLDESLRDPTKFKIETVDLGTYDTTYEVDNNGDPMIATQRNVSHGGTAFKVTNVATGEETFFRKECGGDQQVWPVHTEQVGYQPTESHPGTPETPTVPTTPVTPETPTTPTTPVTPETPITPEQPTGPQPPVNTPKNPLEDINVNPGLPEQNQMGDVRVGSGAPQAEQDVVTPSPNYSPGATGHNDDSVAPGAAPNASPRDNLPPQQAGSSTGTGQAGNGAGAGATTESVGEN